MRIRAQAGHEGAAPQNLKVRNPLPGCFSFVTTLFCREASEISGVDFRNVTGRCQGFIFFFKITLPGTYPPCHSAGSCLFLIRGNFHSYLFIISRPFSSPGASNIHRWMRRHPQACFFFSWRHPYLCLWSLRHILLLSFEIYFLFHFMF